MEIKVVNIMVGLFVVMVAGGCGGGGGTPAASGTIRTTTSSPTTTTTTTTTTIMTSTGNLTLTASFLPKQPKAGELVTFSFVMDDPDASVDYVCGNSYYGYFPFYIAHMPCPPRVCWGQDIGKVYSPVHGHSEWTQTTTYKDPGTYTAIFSKRSGDLSGCNPYGDDVTLSLPVVIYP
jgi:hypothetical protein